MKLQVASRINENETKKEEEKGFDRQGKHPLTVTIFVCFNKTNFVEMFKYGKVCSNVVNKRKSEFRC